MDGAYAGASSLEYYEKLGTKFEVVERVLVLRDDQRRHDLLGVTQLREGMITGESLQTSNPRERAWTGQLTAQRSGGISVARGQASDLGVRFTVWHRRHMVLRPQQPGIKSYRAIVSLPR
jgi:hypothetical protein